MSIPEPNRPPSGPPLRLADAPQGADSLPPPGAGHDTGADAVLSDWLATLDPLLPSSARRGCLDELSDHLRCRVHDLMLTGQAETNAARAACEEMGDVAQIAHRFRSALAAPRRRLAMNLSILAFSAVGLVTGAIALRGTQEPVPVSVFQAPAAAAAPEGFLEAKVTTPKDATFEALLKAVGAPSKLAVEPVWSAFDSVGLSPDANLGLEYGGMPVADVLRDINEHLEPQQRIEWRARDHRLIFATRLYFDQREQVLATYDVAAIVRARAAAAYGSPQALEESAEEVTQLIMELVESDNWRENGGDLASITRFGDKLFIKAPPRMHRQVEWVLAELPAAQVRQPAADGHLWLQPQIGKPTPAAAMPDAPPGESVQVVPLSHAAADDVAKALTGVLKGASLHGVDMQGVRIEALSHTNSLVIVAGKDQHEQVMLLVTELEDVAARHAAEQRAKIERRAEMERERGEKQRRELAQQREAAELERQRAQSGATQAPSPK